MSSIRPHQRIADVDVGPAPRGASPKIQDAEDGGEERAHKDHRSPRMGLDDKNRNLAPTIA